MCCFSFKQMQKSKLITLLKTFSKEEMKNFDKFISSPYFSRGRNLKPLYNVLKKYHPSFDSPHFTEEKIFNKLYPKKKFDGKKSLHTLETLFIFRTERSCSIGIEKAVPLFIAASIRLPSSTVSEVDFGIERCEYVSFRHK